MRCFLPNCSNFKRNPMTKSHGLTFHVIPQEQHLRQAWLAALGMSEGEPKGDSMVCSEHFRKEDFFISKGGRRKLKDEAVPALGIASDDMNAPAALKACRICMCMDIKMYDASHYQLGKVYEQLTGTEWSEEDFLPQKFCWECAGRLVSLSKFRSKALKSLRVMLEILNSCSYLTVKDINTASQTHREVSSTLTQKLFEPYKVNDVCEETIETSCLNDERDMEEDLKSEKIPESIVDEYLNNLTSQMKSELKPGNVTDNGEETDDFFYEYEEQYSDHLSESDENIATKKENKENTAVGKRLKVKVQKETTEVTKKPKAQVRKKKLKIEKDNEEKKKKEGEEKSQDIMEKTSNAKRRKVTGKPITLTFDVSPLSFEEQIAEVQKRKEIEEYKKALYKCEVCYKWFALQERYESHALRHSEKNGDFECFICKFRFKTAYYLKRHVTGLHTRTYRCKECTFVTTHITAAISHKYYHASDEFPCPHCDKVYQRPSTLTNHIRIMHASDHVCEFCGFTFLAKTGLNYHKQRKHGDLDQTTTFEGPHCGECDVKFASDEAHKRHLRTSSKHCSFDDPNRLRNESTLFKVKKPVPVASGPVTCIECGEQFPSVRSRGTHYRLAHPGFYSGLQRRARQSAQVPSACVCEHCGKVYTCKAMLESHMWVHTGVKIHKCDACAKSFSNKTSLIAHKEREHGKGTTYDCEVCGKSFGFLSNKQRHMAVHTGLKPYKCECGKSFISPSARKVHFEHEHLKKPYPKRGPRVRKKPAQPLKSQDN